MKLNRRMFLGVGLATFALLMAPSNLFAAPGAWSSEPVRIVPESIRTPSEDEPREGWGSRSPKLQMTWDRGVSSRPSGPDPERPRASWGASGETSPADAT